MCSTILGRCRNHDAVSGPAIERFRELLSPLSDSGLVEASILREVSGGCWVESGYHTSQCELEENETSRRDAGEIITRHPGSTNIADVDAFVDHEARGACRQSQSSERAIGAHKNVWREFAIDQSCLAHFRRKLIPPANDGHYDVNSGFQALKGSAVTREYTSSTQHFASNKLHVGGSTQILNPEPLCTPGYAFRDSSSDEVSLTASSDILSPKLMPAFVPAAINAIHATFHTRSMSDSTCSFDVDEITDSQPWHDGSKRRKGTIRQMWKDLKTKNAKDWRATGLAKCI